MTTAATSPRELFGSAQYGLLAGPVLILVILMMMILPLPTFMLDTLFTFNIAASVLVLMVSMFTNRPLEFTAFPAILLFTTLLRLSLNVASTRIVLMEGHQGGAAAGQVIEAFGAYLVGGNFAVGLVVFAILVIINFMVITKGAGRIAEVGARFMLDAMPGKQMAIDADLSGGLIGEDEARLRRKEVAQEADFYGSMDGASKFVRGDAIAGLVIMLVNVIGGLAIGMSQHDLSFGEAGKSYTLLTIGDGLVAQIPALIISTAAGVMVSRVDTDQDVGRQMLGQLFVNPLTVYLTAGVIGMLGMVPGMPNLVFLAFAGLLGGLGYSLQKKQEREKLKESALEQASPELPKPAPDASWDDVRLIDVLGLEVGHRLIPLVADEPSGVLLRRVKGVRKQHAQDLGFLPPAVHIRDNLDIDPNGYVVSLKGAVIGEGKIYPNKWLAVNPGGVTGEVEGEATVDPAFGLPSVWIAENLCEQAHIYGYTVVDAPAVVATHLTHLMQKHAAEMLGRTEVKQLLDKLGDDYKPLIEEVIPSVVTMSQLQRILQRLLDEQVTIRDMRTILECLAEHAGQNLDHDELISRVRIALGRAITQKWFPPEGELRVIGLSSDLEQILSQAQQNGSPLEPGLSVTLLEQTEKAIHQQEVMGDPPVMVVSHTLRSTMADFLRRRLKDLVVMSPMEIPEDRILRVTSTVGAQQ